MFRKEPQGKEAMESNLKHGVKYYIAFIPFLSFNDYSQFFLHNFHSEYEFVYRQNALLQYCGTTCISPGFLVLCGIGFQYNLRTCGINSLARRLSIIHRKLLGGFYQVNNTTPIFTEEISSPCVSDRGDQDTYNFGYDCSWIIYN